MPTRMAKMKTRRAPNSGEHADNPAHLHTARGNGVWHSPLEDSWAVSYKTKQATIVSLGSYTPGHTPQRNENECWRKDLCTVEQDSAIKRNDLDTHNSWMDLQRTMLNFQEPVPQSYVLSDSMYMKFVEYNSCKGEEQMRGCQQLKRGREGSGCNCERKAGRIFMATRWERWREPCASRLCDCQGCAWCTALELTIW